MPEGSNLCKKKVRIIPPFYSILYTLWPFGGNVGPGNERNGARTGAGTVSDSDAWHLHLREEDGYRVYCAMRQFNCGYWFIERQLAELGRVFEHVGSYTSGFSSGFC